MSGIIAFLTGFKIVIDCFFEFKYMLIESRKYQAGHIVKSVILSDCRVNKRTVRRARVGCVKRAERSIFLLKRRSFGIIAQENRQFSGKAVIKQVILCF